jgi:hypothetical protein
MDAIGSGGSIPWGDIFRGLLEAGVRPDCVPSLTLSQLYAILSPTSETGPIVQLTLQEAVEFQTNRIQCRDRWIVEQLENFEENRAGHQPISLHRGLESLPTIADCLKGGQPAAEAATDGFQSSIGSMSHVAKRRVFRTNFALSSSACRSVRSRTATRAEQDFSDRTALSKSSLCEGFSRM